MAPAGLAPRVAPAGVAPAGVAPVWVAADRGCDKVVRFLIEECDAAVDKSDLSGASPVSTAASNGRVETLKLPPPINFWTISPVGGVY